MVRTTREIFYITLLADDLLDGKDANAITIGTGVTELAAVSATNVAALDTAAQTLITSSNQSATFTGVTVKDAPKDLTVPTVSTPSNLSLTASVTSGIAKTDAAIVDPVTSVFDLATFESSSALFYKTATVYRNFNGVCTATTNTSDFLYPLIANDSAVTGFPNSIALPLRVGLQVQIM